MSAATRVARRLAAVLLIFWLSACTNSKPAPPTSVPPSMPDSSGRTPVVAPQTPAPPAPAPAPRLDREPCIKDALKHALKQAWEMRKQKGWDPPLESHFSSESIPDVDGDGRSEQLIVDGYMGTATNPHFVYLSNRGCRRYGGIIVAHAESVYLLPEVRNGFRMLRAFGTNGCAGMEGTVMYLAWNGDRYEVVKEIHCDCPDGTQRARRRRDPACP